MLDLFRQYQLDIMLMMSSVCVAIAFFIAILKTASARRKYALILLMLSSAVLLLADRSVYIFDGDTSVLGFWVMRLSNFTVYFSAYLILYSFIMYVSDVCVGEGWYEKPPKRLHVCVVLLVMGTLLLIISQFTGLYYTIDEFNHYQRAPWFILCYIVPAVVIAIILTVIFQNFGKMRPVVRISLLIFTVGPIIASTIQAFTPWISLNNMGLVFFGIFLFSVDLVDMNNRVERAHQAEIEALESREQQARDLLGQTAKALASAIDEKDAYTRGHSVRVAAYAREIARRADLGESMCRRVYYAGLLHDVGKIGIPDDIIAKKGKLTEEEYEIIKTHPERGFHILADIKQAPYLSEAAYHHHERYDGEGYPDGLAAEDIPLMARIIAVADAYDAMTSRRSYRGIMTQEEVKEQLVAGLGSQFDPEYGRIMIQIMDEDAGYRLRETDDEDESSARSAEVGPSLSSEILAKGDSYTID